MTTGNKQERHIVIKIKNITCAYIIFIAVNPFTSGYKRNGSYIIFIAIHLAKSF